MTDSDPDKTGKEVLDESRARGANAVPINELEALVDEWRDRAKDMNRPAMNDAERSIVRGLVKAADELQALIDDYD